jgi:hypothetical protein
MSVLLPPGEALIIRWPSRMVNSLFQSQKSFDVPVMHQRIVLVPIRVQISQSLHLINGPIRGVKI